MLVSNENPKTGWIHQKSFAVLRPAEHWIGQHLRWTTPCQITMARIITSPLVFAIFYWETPIWVKFSVMTPHLLADWFDGILAREFGSSRIELLTSFQNFWEQLNWKGETRLGKLIDPIADKGAWVCVLLPGGWNYLPHEIIVTNLVLAVLLTFSRPIITALFKGEVAANRFGKFKIGAEVLVISGIGLLPHSGPGAVITNSCLILATLLAGASLFVQIYRAVLTPPAH